MSEKPDTPLLREYATAGNEASFHELVRRHTNLIYSSALRQTASPDLARDVAQNVFTALARKAPALADPINQNSSLLGCLFRSRRFEALKQLRGDRRRQIREKQHMEIMDPTSEPAPCVLCLNCRSELLGSHGPKNWLIVNLIGNQPKRSRLRHCQTRN